MGGYQPPTKNNPTEARPLTGNRHKGYITVTVLKREGEPFLGYILVGKGNKKRDCGKLYPAFQCPNCFKLHFVKHRCLEKTCPNCYKIWIYETTKKIAKKIWEYGKILNQKLKEKGINREKRRKILRRLLHIVLSKSEEFLFEYINPITGDFDDKLYIRDALQYLRSKIIPPEGVTTYNPKLAEQYADNSYEKSSVKIEEIGDNEFIYLDDLIAGVLIFHPFRPNERYYEERKEQNREEDENPEKELKKWEWIRNKPNWDDYVKFSPHVHFVGWVIGWLKEPEKGEDWIYKTIGIKGKDKEKYRGIEDKRDLYRVVYYLLTHVGVKKSEKNYHPYVWVGGLANNRVGKPKFKKEKKDRVLKCKKCGHPLAGIYRVLKTFFKVYHNIINFKYFDYEYLKEKVWETDLTPEQISNLLEALKYWFKLKPPPKESPFVVNLS